MAGIQQYTSSLFIQSGSIAKFESGIEVSESLNVDGIISANTLTGDGSQLTGIQVRAFFAGSGSGISSSTPQSIDHVIVLNAGEINATPGSVRIETTHSAGFDPNHYTFIKITDTFETVQSGSADVYVGTDKFINSSTGISDQFGEHPHENDLASGVHRYLVYATDTGSSGRTETVFTTAFIKGYVNVPPIIVVPTDNNDNSIQVTIPFDSSSLDFIALFTASADPNTNQNDFIRVYSASRETIDPSTISANSASYSLLMKHPQSNIENSSNSIATGSFDPNSSITDITNAAFGVGTGASPLPIGSLVFTASISDYNAMDGALNKYDTILPYTESFKIQMFDNFHRNFSSSAVFTMSVNPPPTSSIKNVRVSIEQGSYTGITTTTHTVPILYDDISTRVTTASLDNRYTASLARISVMADITPPVGHTYHSNQNTDIRINRNDNLFKGFRFSGSQATASHYGNAITSPDSNITESLGFAPFSFNAGTHTFNTKNRNDSYYLVHGNENHISPMELGTDGVLTVTAVPNIEISNVHVEIESGSFLTQTGAYERTASILYGYTDSFLTSETSSLEGYEKSAEYISESVIRVRLLATITEPFGPHHTIMKSTITDGSHTKMFEFYTGSADTASSVINYDGADQLVGNYTSSWHEFKFTPGEYVFAPSFTSATQTGISIIGTPVNAEVSVSNTAATQITNIRYETETHGYSEVPSTSTFRTILSGDSVTNTTSESAAWINHNKAVTYASHSVSRFRVLATITEPFGPDHVKSRFEKSWTDSFTNAPDPATNVIHFSTGSVDTASSDITYNNNPKPRLVANYTSSWIGKSLHIPFNSPHTWTYNGAVSHTPVDNSGANIDTIIGSTIQVRDTANTIIENVVYETETFGYSEVGSINAMRTVLYGDPQVTNTGTGSGESGELWANHASASLYASQSVTRFRVLATITEPVGPLHQKAQLPQYWNNNSDETVINNSIQFYTGSPDLDNQSSTNYVGGRYVGQYTSSWIGRQLSSNDNVIKVWNYGSGSTDITYPVGSTSNVTVTTGTSSILEIHDTAPVQFDLIHEFEEYGYSASNAADSGVTNTLRTVLYGHNHQLLADSSSYENHTSASIYTSQSVARTRTRTQVIEPIGPAVASIQVKNDLGGFRPTITLHTASADLESINFQYDSNNRLVSEYTESWIGRNIVLAASAYGSNQTNLATSETATITSSLSNEPNISITTTPATLVTHDTAPTEITNVVYETETFGYSDISSQNAIRTVLYGDPHTTNADSGSTVWTNHPSASIYASHSVTRFRILATITEPVGPLHDSSSFVQEWSDGLETYDNTLTFFTGSSDIDILDSNYNSQNKLVTQYTSSWIGQQLSASTWTYKNGNIAHNSINENGANISSPITTNLLINDTADREITNIVYETETFGYSEVGSINAIRTVLYGDDGTTNTSTSSVAWITHDSASLYASHSVSRFRIKATVTEPIGYVHHGISFGKQWENDGAGVGIKSTFNEATIFNTSSEHVQSTVSSQETGYRLVGHYTSSWIGQSLQNYTTPWEYKAAKIVGVGDGRRVGSSDVEVSPEELTTLLVRNTAPVEITAIHFETETHGYSDEKSEDSFRTVLYGETTTNTGTGSGETGEVWSGHSKAVPYASQSVARSRFRLKITEPIGPAVNQFQVQSNVGSTSTTVVIDTSSFAYNTSSAYDMQNRLVTYYTQSYQGYELLPSTDPYAINGVVSAISTTEPTPDQETHVNADIRVHDADLTEITNIVYETETFGYSDIASRNAIRTVLYGDDRVTNTGTGSGETGEAWASHPSASIYASHSVSRFRILATITEPVGPLHTASRFEKVWSDESETITNVLQFSSASGDIEASSTNTYNNSNQYVSNYTSSWIGQQLSASNWTYTSGSIIHLAYDHDKFTTSSGESTEIIIHDTAPAEITNVVYETETFGYSDVGSRNAIRTVLYGDAHITNDDTSSLYWKNDDNAALYASHSVTRFRVKATITEPLGYLHTASKFEKVWSSDNHNSITDVLNFHSGSSDIEFVSTTSSLETGYRLVSHYTGAWKGQQLNAAVNDSSEWKYTSGSIVHMSVGNDNLITSIGDSSVIVINDSNVTKFENFKTETETFGYSDSPSQSTFRTVLFGDNSITTEDTSSIYWKNHTSASAYASHSVTRFRMLARIIEPFGPLIHTSSNVQMTFTGDSGVDDTKTEKLIFGTASAGFEFISSSFSSSGAHVTEYTSSWIGKVLDVATGHNSTRTWQISTGSIEHNPAGENNADTSSFTSTELQVKNTAKTKIENYFFETEEHGHAAGIETNGVTGNQIRTVLYGVDHHTLANSSSFAGHDSASLYASHSVSRFRVKLKVTEPVGPATAKIQIDKKLGTSAIGTIFAHTSSNNFEASHSFYDGHRLISHYTESWNGHEIITPDNDNTSVTFTTDNTVQINIANEHGIDNDTPNESTTVTVFDTAKTLIDHAFMETETHGYAIADFDDGGVDGNQMRTVLYGDTRVTNTGTASGETGEVWSGHPSASIYASHSVTRFRMRTKIVEPIGPLHNPTTIRKSIVKAGTVPSITSIIFETGSSHQIHSYYDSHGRLINEYTTSFVGSQLDTTSGQTDQWTIKPAFATHDPTGENGFEFDTINDVNSIVMSVNDTAPTEISDIRYETETHGYSDIESTNAIRTVLYGNDRVTDANSGSAVWSGHSQKDAYASASVARFRVKAKVIEPIGYLHTASKFPRKWFDGSETFTDELNFFTQSADLEISKSAYTSNGNLITEYTSSWVGRSLSASTWTYQDNTIEHLADGEQSADIAAATPTTLVVHNTPKTQITNIVYETEEFGLTGDSAQNTERTVLYGIPRYVTADTSSYHGNPSSSRYASASVARFRVLATITEPIGPLHTASRFERIWTNNLDSDDFSDVIHFHTASTDTGSTALEYAGSSSIGYVGARLIGHYTSSWIGQQLSSSTNAPKIWTFEPNNITHNPAGETGLDTISAITPAIVTVNDTPATELVAFQTQIETHGYSDEGTNNAIRTVLYGNNQITDANSGSAAWVNHIKADKYASSSIARFRMSARIIEPMGPLIHTASHATIQIGNIDTAGDVSLLDDKSQLIIFGTGSTQHMVSSSFISESGAFVTEYTSSWFGQSLSAGTVSTNYVITSSDVSHSYYNENGTQYNFTPTSLTVFNTPPTEITNIVYETETHGYSDIGSLNAMRTVLYGDTQTTNDGTGSGDTGESWSGNSRAHIYASHSVTRFRVKATVTEPVGPLHTASRFEKVWSNDSGFSEINSVMHFHSNSIDTASSAIGYVDNRYTGHYTSSWYSQSLSASAGDITTWTFTSGSILHEPVGENGFTTQTGTGSKLIVRDTPKSQIDNIVYETETFGYSDVPTRSSIRTVLYGDPHTTNIDSGSTVWANHPSASIYASHSVTRYRVKARITDPIGPYHTGSFLQRAWQTTTSARVDLSLDRITLNGISEAFGSNLGVQGALNDNDSSVAVLNEIQNGDSIEIDLDNSDTIVNSINLRFNRDWEGFVPGYINTGINFRYVLYAKQAVENVYTQIATSTDVADVYNANATINVDWPTVVSTTVPYRYWKIEFTDDDGSFQSAFSNLVQLQIFENVVGGPGNEITSDIILSSSLASVSASHSYYNTSDQFVVDYTSSFEGQQLSGSDNGTNSVLYILSTKGATTPSVGNNGIDITGEQLTTSVTVFDTAPTEIADIVYETETHGYSDVGSTNAIRTVLYGDDQVSNTGTGSGETGESWGGHTKGYAYASASVTRFRVKATVTEPLGYLHADAEFERVWSNNDHTNVSDVIIFNTASADLISTTSSLETGYRLLSRYTGSWIGLQLSSSTSAWKFTSGSITSPAPDENGNTADVTNDTELLVNDTLPTQIINYKIEAETFGHSNVGIQNSLEANASQISKSILYGNTTTNASTESLVNYAGIYSSSAVTRFRILSDIIEPIGYLHTSSVFKYEKLNGGTDIDSFGYAVEFMSSSIDTASSTIGYALDNRYAASYTSSWITESLSPSTTHTTIPAHQFRIQENDITHGHNSFTGEGASNLYFQVSASDAIQVDNLNVEVEEFPYSSSTGANSRTQKILYGFNRTLSASDANTIGDPWSGSAAIRVRVLASITEPFGPAHFKTSVNLADAVSGKNKTYEFYTGSNELSEQTASSTVRALNSNDKFVQHFTSSWHDGFTFKEGSYTFSPTATVDGDLTGVYKNNDEIDTSNVNTPNATITIQDTDATAITNVRFEIEHIRSGSNEGRAGNPALTDTMRQSRILHGLTETVGSVSANNNLDTNDESREQLVSMRVLADIQEPFGPHHTASKIDVGIFHVPTSSVIVIPPILEVFSKEAKQPLLEDTSSLFSAGTQVLRSHAYFTNGQFRQVSAWGQNITDDEILLRNNSNATYHYSPAAVTVNVDGFNGGNLEGFYADDMFRHNVDITNTAKWVVWQMPHEESFGAVRFRSHYGSAGNIKIYATNNDDAINTYMGAAGILPSNTQAVLEGAYDPKDYGWTQLANHVNTNGGGTNFGSNIYPGTTASFGHHTSTFYRDTSNSSTNHVTQHLVFGNTGSFTNYMIYWPTGSTNGSTLFFGFRHFNFYRSRYIDSVRRHSTSESIELPVNRSNGSDFNNSNRRKLLNLNSVTCKAYSYTNFSTTMDPTNPVWNPYVHDTDPDFTLASSLGTLPGWGFFINQFDRFNKVWNPDTNVYDQNVSAWGPEGGASPAGDNTNFINYNIPGASGTNMWWLQDTRPVSRSFNKVKLAWHSAADRRNSEPEIWGSNDQNCSGSGLYVTSTDPYAPTGWYKIATLSGPLTNDVREGDDFTFSNSSSYFAYKIVFPNDTWASGITADGDNRAGLRKIYFYESVASEIAIGAEELAFIRQTFEYENAALQGDKFEISMHTGSAYEDSIINSYTVHHSHSMAYTSSFIPISLENTGSDSKYFIISSSLNTDVEHMFENKFTVAAASIFTASIGVDPATSASVTVSPVVSGLDNDWSSSSDIPTTNYVTYNNTDIEVDVVSGVGGILPAIASTALIQFPAINIFYSASSTDITLKNLTDTASVEILSSYMGTLTNIEDFEVFISASDSVSTDSSSSLQSLPFSIIPAKPQSMHGKYWSIDGANDNTGDIDGTTSQGHEIHNNLETPGISVPVVDGQGTGRLYTADLATNLIYNIDDTIPNPGTVTNVVMAKESHTGPVNYSMNFTPPPLSFTGNYQDDQRLFDFGDTGSLIVKINGETVVNADLSDGFDANNKHTSQTLSNYNAGAWNAGTASFTGTYANKGRLILTNVHPFNNVSQSIHNGDRYYPNGYQGWNARIELTDKLNHGYNKLEFSHSIDPTPGVPTQDWQPFEWYYDDNIQLLHLSDQIPSFVATDAVFNLSGVGYFKSGNQLEFDAINMLNGLIGQTFRRQTSNTFLIQTNHSHGSDITMLSKENNVIPFNHSILVNDGLLFNNNNVALPNAFATGSINDIKITGDITEAPGLTTGKSVAYQIQFNQYIRNFNAIDSWTLDTSNTQNLPIGRFINTSLISTTYSEAPGSSMTSTDTFEDFYSETRRWNNSATGMQQAAFNFNSNAGGNIGTANAGGNSGGRSGYERWLTGNFVSSDLTEITTGVGLQQAVNGFLQYPTEDYTSYDGITGDVILPTAANYSGLTGDRYYYRAFKIPETGGNNFNLYVYTPGTGTTPDASTGVDFLNEAFIQSGDIDVKDLRIDIKLPGPVANSPGYNQPGTQWLNICALTNFSFTYGAAEQGCFDAAGLSTVGYGAVKSGAYLLKANMGAFSKTNSGGVILVRIRFKSGYNKYITGIELESQ